MASSGRHSCDRRRVAFTPRCSCISWMCVSRIHFSSTRASWTTIDTRQRCTRLRATPHLALATPRPQPQSVSDTCARFSSRPDRQALPARRAGTNRASASSVVRKPAQFLGFPPPPPPREKKEKKKKTPGRRPPPERKKKGPQAKKKAPALPGPPWVCATWSLVPLGLQKPIGALESNDPLVLVAQARAIDRAPRARQTCCWLLSSGSPFPPDVLERRQFRQSQHQALCAERFCGRANLPSILRPVLRNSHAASCVVQSPQVSPRQARGGV